MLILIVPLLIHLFNRGKRKAVPFGSLLWLPQKNKKLSRQIQLSHWWLWLLRSLIFAAVAILIAQPFTSEIVQHNHKNLLLLQPNVQPEIFQQIEDTIDFKKWEVKWLSYNLLPVDFEKEMLQLPQKVQVFDVLQLINSKQEKPLSVTIVGNFNATELKGKRNNYSFPVEWVLLPRKDQPQPIAYLQGESSLVALTFNEQNYLAQIEKSSPLEPLDNNLSTINLRAKNFTIVYDELHKNLQKSVSAALKALGSYYAISFKINTIKSENYSEELKDIDLFWLSSMKLPALSQASKLYLLSSSLPKGAFVLISEKQVEWREPAELKKIPYLLNDMIFKQDAIDNKIAKMDSRSVHPSFFNIENRSFDISGSYSSNQKKSFLYYVWFIIMIFLAIERYLSSQ